MLMALAGEVAGPCAGKNKLKKAPKIIVCVKQPTLQIFS